jgi:hypothetical protein
MERLKMEPLKMPQPRQTEYEEEHEQEQEPMKGHKVPHCLICVAWTVSLSKKRKNKQGHEDSQAFRREY